jgi:hypothetical protein
MPRKSAAAIEAAWFLRENAPPPPPHPEPPAILSGRAKGYWAEIVSSKPPEYFDAANRILLECLCFHLTIADAIWPEIAKLDPSNPKDLRRYRQLSVIASRQSATASHLMTKLRLLPTKYMALKESSKRQPSRVPWEVID